MIEVRTTAIFSRWFENLSDKRARIRIQMRIDRLELGHFGNTAFVGSGIYELRLFYGPGYRVYFVRRGDSLVLLLSGGTKGTQQTDIARAKAIARQLED